MKTTTAVGIMGSVVINLMLGIVIAAVFSVTPSAQAREVAQCPAQHTEHATTQPAAGAWAQRRPPGRGTDGMGGGLSATA